MASQHHRRRYMETSSSIMMMVQNGNSSIREDTVQVIRQLDAVVLSLFDEMSQDIYDQCVESISEWMTHYSGRSVIGGASAPLVVQDSRFKQNNLITDQMTELVVRFNAALLELYNFTPDKSRLCGKNLGAKLPVHYGKQQNRPLSLQDVRRLDLSSKPWVGPYSRAGPSYAAIAKPR
jgi:hypothetical protein